MKIAFQEYYGASGERGGRGGGRRPRGCCLRTQKGRLPQEPAQNQESPKGAPDQNDSRKLRETRRLLATEPPPPPGPPPKPVETEVGCRKNGLVMTPW